MPRHQPQSTNQQPRLCRRRDFRTLLMLPTPANPQHALFVSSACMQDSNTATTTRAGGDARREPVMDRTTTMRVSPCHPFFSFLPLLPFLLPLPCMVLCCENVCARKTLSKPSFFFQTPDYPLVCSHCGPSPSCDLPACTSNPCATCLGRRASTSIQFTPHACPHVPLQTYLDFNTILSFVRRVRVFESCVIRTSQFWIS